MIEVPGGRAVMAGRVVREATSAEAALEALLDGLVGRATNGTPVATDRGMRRYTLSFATVTAFVVACGPTDPAHTLAEAADAVVKWVAEKCNSSNTINVTWTGDVSVTVPIRDAAHFGLGDSAGQGLLARLTAREARDELLRQVQYQQGLASFTCPGCERGDGCEQWVSVPATLPPNRALSLTLGYGAHDCRDDGTLDRECTITDPEQGTITVFGELAMNTNLTVGCSACAWPKGCAYGSDVCKRHPATPLPANARLATAGPIVEIRATEAIDE